MTTSPVLSHLTGRLKIIVPGYRRQVGVLLGTITLAGLLAQAPSARAVIIGPYAPDAFTLHLWHLDNAATPATDSTTNANTLPLAAAANGASLNHASFAGFGTALSTADGGQNGIAAADKDAVLSALTPVNGAGDNVTTWSFADPATGAFTFEAIVRIDFDPVANLGPAPAGNGRNAPMQLIAGEQDGTGGGVRSWQFRLDPVGFNPNAGGITTPLTQPALEFININNGSSVQYLFAFIPTNGPDAIGQGQWYHIAVAYNGNQGTADNLQVYWTLLDQSRSAANLILSAQMTLDLPAGAVDLTLGNTGRGTPNGNFVGLMDEVRLSRVARGPMEMLFMPTELVFTCSPASQFVGTGQPAEFSACVFGAPPISYQWRKNGKPLEGATNSALAFAAAQPADSGVYDVVVTNLYSSVTSAVATLTVTNLAITIPPADVTAGYGGQATFAVSGVGALPLSYQWRHNGADLPDATNRMLTLAPLRFTQAGAYDVVIANSLSALTSAVATLTVGPPQPVPIPDLFNTGVGADGAPLAGGAVDPHWKLIQSADGTYPGPDSRVFTSLPGTWLANSAASQWVSPVTSGNCAAGDYVYRTAFDLTGCVPDTAVLHIKWASDNAGTAVHLNGVAVPVALSPGFTAFTITSNLVGAFVVGTNVLEFTVNNAGTTASQTGLRVELSGTVMPEPPPDWPASLAIVPTAQAVNFGSPVMFYAGGYGTAPLAYQWRFNGVDIFGATNATLALGNATPTLGGLYEVIVSNAFGSVTSAPAALKVLFFTGPSSRRTGLVFSEIMYHSLRSTNGLNLDFVELYNSNPWTEDISGYRLTGDINFTFPAGTIIGGGNYLVVAQNPAAVQAHYGVAGVFGPFSGELNNGGGTLRLRKPTDAILLEVQFSDQPPWPLAADGAGHSLVCVRPDYGEADPRAWAPSAFIGGSPGTADFATLGLIEPAPVVLNEILAHTDLPLWDYVELYNRGANAVDLSGCWLSDDAETNKYRIADGTVLPPGSHLAFDELQLGFALSATGDEVLLVNSNRTRVLDALRFGGQANGVALGRYPDGAPEFRELAAITPGTPNAAALQRDIVINEIMYHPISNDPNDEYVELFNRGSNTVSVGGWRLTDAILFIFPGFVQIPAGGYVVVAKSPGQLRQHHPELDPAIVFGPYDGVLSDAGERLALEMRDTLVVTNATNALLVTTQTFYVVVNEVNWRDGGTWGQWSDGGGSSLELVDARGDNRLAATWADSDESAKAGWTTIEHTGTLDWGHPTVTSINQLQMLLLDAGECLVDDVEVIPQGGANVVANSSFESGTSGWTFQGTHRLTFLRTNEGFGSAQSLQLVAVDRGDLANRVLTPLSSTLSAGSVATLRVKARWLRGHPELLVRLWGSYLDVAGRLAVPPNLGTPGAPNGRARANLGPVIADVAHAPVLPAANQPITVTARVSDGDGAASVVLRYRLDPATSYTELSMNDSGSDGDLTARDGVFTAVIPGQASSGTLVAFYLEATDAFTPPAVSRFPEGAPAPECLVRIGDTPQTGEFAHYRVWLTASNYNFWATRQKSSDEPVPCTFVYDDRRVFYGASIGYAFSDNSTRFVGTPLNSVVGFGINLPKDDPLLGTDFVRLDPSEKDPTVQRQSIMYWMLDQMGLPNSYRRYVHWFINGNRRSTIYEDTQRPNREMVEEWYPADSAGDLIKTDPYQEADANGAFTASTTAVLPHLEHFYTTNGANVELKTAAYRWTFRPRAYATSGSDYTNFFRLLDAMNAPDSNYLAAVAAEVDITQWMRTFAHNDLVAFWDTFGNTNAKNAFLYRPAASGWQVLCWDFDVGLGQFRADRTNAALFEAVDPALQRLFNTPAFMRTYWAALEEGLNSFFTATPGSAVDRLLRERYEAFVRNGVGVTSPFVPSGESALSIPDWIAGRRAFIGSQLAAVQASFVVAAPTETVTTNHLLVLTGTAPVGAAWFEVNRQPLTPVWHSLTDWTLVVPLTGGINHLALRALSAHGTVLGTTNFTVEFTGELAWPAVRINEWMADNSGGPQDPADNDREDWFELYNPTTNTVDLADWYLSDTVTNVYQFKVPAGYTIPPGGFLLVWADSEPLQNTTNRPDLHVNFKLDRQGETLVLSAPDGTLMDKVTFGPQVQDVSEGRSPDGSNRINSQWRFTPRAANAGPPAVPEILHVGISNHQVTLIVRSTPNYVYQAEYKTHLDDTSWLPLGGQWRAVGSTLPLTYSQGTNTQRFFRVWRSPYPVEDPD